MRDLQEVASVYLAACADGAPPTATVEARFGCARSTAGRWVSEAREAGLLPPTMTGVSPRQNRKIVAVARALDVEPAALVQAIRDHADSDLRVPRFRKERTRITRTLLAEVAEVYREHFASGAPTQAVAKRWGLAPSTAVSYVCRARAAGFDLGGLG